MLGISTTTVSNVINGKTSEVSQKTAEKVQKLLDEYDYVPNMNAKISHRTIPDSSELY